MKFSPLMPFCENRMTQNISFFMFLIRNIRTRSSLFDIEFVFSQHVFWERISSKNAMRSTQCVMAFMFQPHQQSQWAGAMLKFQKFPFRTGIKMRHWYITPLLIDTNLTCFFFKVSSRKKNRILFVTRNLRSPFLIFLTNSRKCSSHYLCLWLAWCSMGSQF